MNRYCWISILLFLFLSVAFPVHADSGKILYKSLCHSCHVDAATKAIAPIDKASSQWKRFFKRNKHQRKSEINLKSKFDDPQLEIILAYLIDHASDSNQPEVAGSL